MIYETTKLCLNDTNSKSYAKIITAKYAGNLTFKTVANYATNLEGMKNSEGVPAGYVVVASNHSYENYLRKVYTDKTTGLLYVKLEKTKAFLYQQDKTSMLMLWAEVTKLKNPK